MFRFLTSTLVDIICFNESSMYYNIRAMPFELIMNNRSFHFMFFHTLCCAHSKMTWWLNKNLILNNADNVIKIYKFRNNIDNSITIDFEKIKIRAAKTPSIFLQNVFWSKISNISIDYDDEIWSWHNVKKNRRMIECKKKIFWKKILSKFDLELWISFSPNIVKHVIQFICHSDFSSKIQIIAINMFDQM